MRTQFLADENLRRAIVLGVRRREPGVSFIEAFEAGIVAKRDPAVLRVATIPASNASMKDTPGSF